MGNGDFREMMAAEMISITGGLLAGVVLASMTNQISLIPGLFILIPGFLEMRGAVSGSMASRISSGLFLNVVKPRMRRNGIVASNMMATAVLVILCSAILGILAYFASSWIFGIENVRVIFISVIAGAVSLVMMPLTVYTAIWLFRKGHDPNNIMGPYITTLGDVVSVGSFMIAIVAVS